MGGCFERAQGLRKIDSITSAHRSNHLPIDARMTFVFKSWLRWFTCRMLSHNKYTIWTVIFKKYLSQNYINDLHLVQFSTWRVLVRAPCKLQSLTMLRHVDKTNGINTPFSACTAYRLLKWTVHSNVWQPWTTELFYFTKLAKYQEPLCCL